MPRKKIITHIEPVQDTTPLPRYLSARQVAGILGVTITTACQYIRSGKIRASFVGKKYMIERSAVEDFVNAAALPEQG